MNNKVELSISVDPASRLVYVSIRFNDGNNIHTVRNNISQIELLHCRISLKNICYNMIYEFDEKHRIIIESYLDSIFKILENDR